MARKKPAPASLGLFAEEPKPTAPPAPPAPRRRRREPARLTAAELEEAGDFEPDPPQCDACDKPIGAGEKYAIHERTLLHDACLPEPRDPKLKIRDMESPPRVPFSLYKPEEIRRAAKADPWAPFLGECPDHRGREEHAGRMHVHDIDEIPAVTMTLADGREIWAQPPRMVRSERILCIERRRLTEGEHVSAAFARLTRECPREMPEAQAAAPFVLAFQMSEGRDLDQLTDKNLAARATRKDPTPCPAPADSTHATPTRAAGAEPPAA